MVIKKVCIIIHFEQQNIQIEEVYCENVVYGLFDMSLTEI